MRVQISIQPCDKDLSLHHREARSYHRPVSARPERHISKHRRSKSEERIVDLRPTECESPVRQYRPLYRPSPSPVRMQARHRTPVKYVYSTRGRSPSDSAVQVNETERILYPSSTKNCVNIAASSCSLTSVSASSSSSSSSHTSSISSDVEASSIRIVKKGTPTILHHIPVETERVVRSRPVSPALVVQMSEPKEYIHRIRKHPSHYHHYHRHHYHQPRPVVIKEPYHRVTMPSTSGGRLERRRLRSSSSEENVFYVVHEVEERPGYRKVKKRHKKKSKRNLSRRSLSRRRKFEGCFKVIESS